jgi:hypothetical protein
MTLNAGILPGALIPMNKGLPLPPILFQFNPSEITDDKQVNYKNTERTGAYSPDISFVSGGTRSISFKLVLEGLHPPKHKEYEILGMTGVFVELERLRSLIAPNNLYSSLLSSVTGKSFEEPPHCLFVFGPQIIACRVQKLSIQETHFNAYLIPVRAEVQITLIEEPLTKIGD